MSCNISDQKKVTSGIIHHLKIITTVIQLVPNISAQVLQKDQGIHIGLEVHLRKGEFIDHHTVVQVLLAEVITDLIEVDLVTRPKIVFPEGLVEIGVCLTVKAAVDLIIKVQGGAVEVEVDQWDEIKEGITEVEVDPLREV